MQAEEVEEEGSRSQPFSHTDIDIPLSIAVRLGEGLHLAVNVLG